MRCVTHQFSSTETLERAKRWLLDAGISPERMIVHRHGIPGIAVAVEGGEADVVGMIIRVAARQDPGGLPGFWDLAHLPRVAPDGVAETVDPPPPPSKPSGFVLSWQPAERRPLSEPEVDDVGSPIADREP